MATKKPKSAGKGKTKSKSNPIQDAEESLALGEKLAKSQAEVSVYQQELEMQNDLIARIKSQNAMQKRRILELEELLERKTIERIEVEADLKAQIKRLKADMVEHVASLEAELKEVREQFGRSTQANETAIKELTKSLNEKEMLIEDQNANAMYLSSEFEAMLNDTLSKITTKLGDVSSKWEDMPLNQLNQSRLNDFNLTRLALE
ncbi:hypothetical protein HDU93_001892 [Gonapodya sp. JEL0774]|nr:hypothetical protein HDU93_001892 [Gonapodya sp. JEL0774]